MIIIKLMYEFFLIGLFTFGGGMATIPYLKDLAERTNWYDISFITDMIAISESTPGPIGINMATFVGYKVAGVLGGILASISEIIPSIIIIILVSNFYNKFKNNQITNNIFYGIRPTVTALIASAGFEVLYVSVMKQNVSLLSGINNIINNIELIEVIFFGIILYLILKFKKHPVSYILLSGLIGIIFKLT